MLPTDTAAANALATLATDALNRHQASEKALNELALFSIARQLSADHVRELTARVADLSATALELSAKGAPTTETEVLRAGAVADLDSARLDASALDLRIASAENIADAARADYERARAALANAVAPQGGVDAKALDANWATTGPARVDVVYAALTQLGDPYVFGSVGPDAFDCSGLTAFAWQAAGVTLPHYTVSQRTSTLDVQPGSLQAGDLVFNLNGPNGGHVMMYLGVGQAIVEARAPGTNVMVSTWRSVTGFGSPLADGRADASIPATVAATLTNRATVSADTSAGRTGEAESLLANGAAPASH